MKKVTYRGPTDSADGTTIYSIDGVNFERGVPVSVKDEVAEQAKNQDGHSFDVRPDKED